MTTLGGTTISGLISCPKIGEAQLTGLIDGAMPEGVTVTPVVPGPASGWAARRWDRVPGDAAFGTGASPTGHVAGEQVYFRGTTDIGGTFEAGPFDVVAAQAVQGATTKAHFGGNTAAFAGGYQPFDDGSPVALVSIDDAGTGTRTWSLQGGKLVANGAPAADHGRILTCTGADANSYVIEIVSDNAGRTVASDAEFLALPQVAAGYSGPGGDVFIRWMADPGAPGDKIDTRAINLSGRFTGLTSYLRFTSADPLMKGRINGFKDLSGKKFLEFDGLVLMLGWSVAKQESVLSTSILGLGDNATDIRVRNCVFESTIPGFHEMMAADLPQSVLRAGTSHPGNGTGQPFVWAVDMHYGCKRIDISGNFIQRLSHGIYVAGEDITVADNLMSRCWGDFKRFAGDDTRDTKNVVIARNFGINWVHDGSCQHADAQQWAQSEAGGYDGVTDVMNIYVLGSLGVRAGGAGIPYGDTAGGLKVAGTSTMANSTGVQVRWFDTLNQPGLCILPPTPGGTIWIQMLPNGDAPVHPLTIRVSNTGSQRITGVNGSTTSIVLNRTCAMVKLTPSGSNWAVQYMASNVTGRLQQRQDINNYLCRGNISVLASWHGLWQGAPTAGSGVSVLDNLFAAPVPGDVDGDGLVTCVDGLGNGNAPWIDIPNAATNVTCARNIAAQLKNKAAGGGALLPTAGPGYAGHFQAFANGEWFPDVDESVYLVAAPDGFQDMTTFAARLQQSREIIAGYCLLKPGSSLIGNGPVGTSLSNGTVKWKSMLFQEETGNLLSASDSFHTDAPWEWGVFGASTGPVDSGEVNTVTGARYYDLTRTEMMPRVQYDTANGGFWRPEAGADYVWSFYVKNVDGQDFALDVMPFNGATNIQKAKLRVYLAGGTISPEANPGAMIAAQGLQDIGGGAYRVWVRFRTPAGTDNMRLIAFVGDTDDGAVTLRSASWMVTKGTELEVYEP